MRKFLFLFTTLLFAMAGIAQETAQDTTKPALPFFIDPMKRMPDFEIDVKKEGTFVTGLPRAEFDPIRGFGVGGDVFLFFNKDKNDPFFEYTPYRHRVKGQFFIFQNGRVRYEMNYDAPYIFNSKWRLRVDAVLWEDPNAQYWGMGSNTLNPLSFVDQRTGQLRTWDKVDDYEENLGLAVQDEDGNYLTNFHENHMLQREQLYNLLGERIFMGGKLRFMFGYEALFTSFQSYGGKVAEEAFNLDGEEVDAVNTKTSVERDIADGIWEQYNLGGFNNSTDYLFTSMLAAALIYDTRDFEPDPSKGVFFEYSHEYSAPWLASNFDFNKFMIQGQYFKTLARWGENKTNRLTFAGMASFGYVFGPNINFIEMWDLSSQAEAGGIMVLGGDRSIRGFREARFMAPTVGLINLELRTRLYEFDALKQHFSLGLTPFYDAGTAWDSPSKMTFANWKGAPGIGGRLGWNQSTILRLDFARSSEGSQVFFGFSHIF